MIHLYLTTKSPDQDFWENRVELANDEMHSPNSYWEATGTWLLGTWRFSLNQRWRSLLSWVWNLVNIRSIPLVHLLSPAWVVPGDAERKTRQSVLHEYFRSSSQANPASLWPNGGFLLLSYLFSSCSFFFVIGCFDVVWISYTADSWTALCVLRGMCVLRSYVDFLQ